MEDILALLPAEESPYLTPVVPREDILTPALTATRKHTEKAIEAVNVQLLALVHRHIPPQQAGVFLASLLQVMCSYWQEMDGMATSQVVLLGQIVPNLWGVSWSMMEGLTLLGPPNCPASWPASLVERVSADPTNRATPVGLTTPVKCDTSSVSGKGKLPPGSSGKKLFCLSKLPTTGITQKGIRRMKNPAGRRKKGIRRRSTVVLCYLLMNMRNQSRFLPQSHSKLGIPGTQTAYPSPFHREEGLKQGPTGQFSPVQLLR